MNPVLSVILALSCALASSAAPADFLKNPMEAGRFQGDIAGVDAKALATLHTLYVTYWPNGVIPYEFAPNTYTESQMVLIRNSMNQIEKQTRVESNDCIKFVPRTTEKVYLRIYNGVGCWSYVGMNRASGPQDVSIMIGSWSSCLYQGTIMHELTHAIGFWHEQSRFDRDDYVTINWENIAEANKHNFEKLVSATTMLGFKYDYYSIMHYEWNSFSTNGKATIVPKQAGVDLIQSSSKYSLSPTDVEAIRKLYKCTA